MDRAGRGKERGEKVPAVSTLQDTRRVVGPDVPTRG